MQLHLIAQHVGGSFCFAGGPKRRGREQRGADGNTNVVASGMSSCLCHLSHLPFATSLALQMQMQGLKQIPKAGLDRPEALGQGGGLGKGPHILQL